MGLGELNNKRNNNLMAAPLMSNEELIDYTNELLLYHQLLLEVQQGTPIKADLLELLTSMKIAFDTPVMD